MTEEQRASIRLVSGDGARWITDAVAKYCPNATRCLDPFHVVEWANDALSSMRIDAWRRAREKLSETVRKYKEAGVADDKEVKEEIKREQKRVDEIKQSKYALGKNPENLTKNQQERLELIQAEDPQIKRGHDLKEKLRLILKLKDPELIRIACGFRDIDTMIALIMLFCSSIEIPWPARMTRPPVK